MSTRQIVVHHDDIAANHGTNAAFVELFDLGTCSSGSVMVPCPWFPEIAEIARRRPDLDLGVHLTLNAEFAPYRWRPLTGVSGNGLTDSDGYMWRDVPSARHADPAAVEAEMRAQIDTALAAGIDVTHLDSHMGTIAMPEYLDIYVRLGAEYRLPIFLIRDVVGFAAASSHGADVAARYAGAFDGIVERGNPAFAKFVTSPWGNEGEVEAAYRRILDSCAPGLNWGAFHFDMPGAIEAYSPDARMRIDEYEFFRSGRAKALLEEFDIELIGMRGFRDAMRSRA
jgi:chitin disaccharide deacetylase